MISEPFGSVNAKDDHNHRTWRRVPKVRAVGSLGLVLIAGEVGDSVCCRFYFQVVFLCFADFLCMYRPEWEGEHTGSCPLLLQ